MSLPKPSPVETYSIDQAILDAAGAEPLDNLGLGAEWYRVFSISDYSAIEDLNTTAHSAIRRRYIRNALRRLRNSKA